MLIDRAFPFLAKRYRVYETFPRANFTVALWRRSFLCNKLARDKRDGGQENSQPDEKKNARAKKSDEGREILAMEGCNSKLALPE